MKKPIPEPLRGIEYGTFTHSSVVERLPEIAERTIDENDFSSDVVSKVQSLIDEIPEEKMRLLHDPEAPDAEDWHSYVSEFLDCNWLEVPWFFVEFYFYRRILEATGYFRTGDANFQLDPFNPQKQRGLNTALTPIGELAALVGDLIQSGDSDGTPISHLIKIGLWGNQADLSMWPVDESGKGEQRGQSGIEDRIIVDHSEKILTHIGGLQGRASRIDLILDNAGFELMTDFFLADYLISAKVVEHICLHPKAYPIFVSDVIPADLEWTLDLLAEGSDGPIRSSVERVREYVRMGRLTVCEDVFWTSPLAMWEMPDRLREQLSNSDLVVFKGDMNYRRLLGDRHWDFVTPFEEIMGYFPAPVVAIRTLKAEVVCGLEEGQELAIADQDPEWMVNGRWGVVQFRE